MLPNCYKKWQTIKKKNDHLNLLLKKKSFPKIKKKAKEKKKEYEQHTPMPAQ